MKYSRTAIIQIPDNRIVLRTKNILLIICVCTMDILYNYFALFFKEIVFFYYANRVRSQFIRIIGVLLYFTESKVIIEYKMTLKTTRKVLTSFLEFTNQFYVNVNKKIVKFLRIINTWRTRPVFINKCVLINSKL